MANQFDRFLVDLPPEITWCPFCGSTYTQLLLSRDKLVDRARIETWACANCGRHFLLSHRTDSDVVGALYRNPDRFHVWCLIALYTPIGEIRRNFRACARCDLLFERAGRFPLCTGMPPPSLPADPDPVYLRQLMEQGWYPERLSLHGEFGLTTEEGLR